jgi:uncharacterized protein (DUF3820 family)
MNESFEDPATDANRACLLKLCNTRMPYGRYNGWYLLDLPEPYVVWMSHNGFPKGELGQMLKILYEIKLNGLESMLAPLRASNARSDRKQKP